MNTDDPKFTAHALGEMDDLTPAERAEIAALLAADAGAATDAEETRALAACLRSELQTEQTAPLTAAQRAAVLAANVVPVSFGWAGEEGKTARPPSSWRHRSQSLALAASVAVCGLLAWQALIAPPPPMAEDHGLLTLNSTLEMPKMSEPPVGEAQQAESVVKRVAAATPKLAAAPLATKLADADKQLAQNAPAESPARMAGKLKPSGQAQITTFFGVADAPAKPEAQALAKDGETNLEFREAAGAKSQMALSGLVLAEEKVRRLGLSDERSASAPAQPATPPLAASEPAKAPEKMAGAARDARDKNAGNDAGKAKALLDEAQKFAAAGRHDLAFKRFEQVLNIDPYNKQARAGEEAVARANSEFDITAYNETRARAVPRVDVAWGNPVRKFNQPPGASASSAGYTRGTTATGPLAKADATDRYSYESEAVRLPNAVGVNRSVTVNKGESNPQQSDSESAESYDFIPDNAFLSVVQAPLSTFSIDVDTASYAIVRRFLNEQNLPPKGAVRIEELINYFTFDYPQPQGDAPFSATTEVAACPWTPAHRLVRIGLKGREIAKDKRPASNLVFLIDVSDSMQPANKLPLLKQSLGLLIDQLGAEDQVAMVVYAGKSGTVLEPTRNKAKMRAALAKLEAGGSTNGASGVQLAYELAEKSFIKGGTNRVILATDGDWNVGVTEPKELFELITKKAKGGVFLTVLGYGIDNLKDSMLVKLADKGNGNYGYIDTLIEAKKLLADELSSTLVTIAKDVKIQVEFNPAQVAAYRLIGYEKRLLAKEDFNDDTKDAGEIGAGHTVTALYEVVPAGGAEPPQFATVDELKYQRPAPAEKPETRNQKSEISPELLTLKLRYKAPDGDASKLLEFPLTDAGAMWERSSRDFRFAAAVAGYGMLLRDSPHKGAATWDSVRELAVEGKGEDPTGYRAQFITLLEKAKALAR